MSKPAPVINVNVSVSPSKPSALDTLRALGAKKTAPAEVALSSRMSDPAIAGARPAKGSKSTVLLGFDPDFADKARHAADLKDALDRATADFVVLQADARDYGKKKRSLYNEAFKTDITTVSVPYTVMVPGDQADGAVATETRYMKVICSNKYSVSGESVLANKDAFGDSFDRLFLVEETKSLKPNAEELVRGLLVENGIDGEELDNAMSSLFETKVKVSTRDTFESEEAKLAPELRSVLSQTVKRAEPGLKFD